MSTNNFETNLEWKNHEPFFRYLNEALNEISEVEAGIYANTKEIYKYFALISALYSKHICYVSDTKTIETELEKIRKGLYSGEVMKRIEKKPNDPSLVQHLLKIYDGLVGIYRELVSDFAKHELLPKVTKVDTSTPSAVRNLK